MTKQYDPDVEALLGPLPGSEVAIVGGAFEGASRFDRTLALWAPPLNSADTDIREAKSETDSRARDTLRNDAYVQGGGNIHKDNIVGAMYVLNAKPATKVLGLDETWETEFQEEVETKFTLWAESPNCWADASRMNTLTSLVRLAVGVYVMAGEVLATAEWIRDEPDRLFKTAIQMVDLDRLSNPNLEADTPTRRMGVERSKRGSPLGYWIRGGHPTDWTNPDSYFWKYVPVRKPWGRVQVFHCVEQSRPDQTRGISDMVAALKEMRITKRYRDVVLQNAVVNATYAASIESDLPPEAVFAQLGGGNVGDAISGYAAAYLGAIQQYVGNSRNMHIDGVKIPHFFPGTKLKLQNAGTPGGIGAEFEQSLLRYIAANLGVSYEQLSKDYSKTNYSSARAGMNETWKFMQARKRMVADRFASTVYRLWLEEAINKGEITSLSKRAPSWYDGMNADAYSAGEWIGASRGQIDELKETQAAVLRLKYHLSTYEDEAARLGRDWRKMLAQRERETKELKARGLVVEEANAINAASGAPRDKTTSGAGDGDGGSADE